MFFSGKNTLAVIILVITSYDLVNSMLNGQNARIENHPYHAGVLRTNGDFLCSGAIIGLKRIVTAAHCVQDENISSLVVVAGNELNYASLYWHPVKQVVVHPKYSQQSPGNSTYDIAIVQIKDIFEESDDLQVINVARQKKRSNISRATVTGWRNTMDRTDDSLQVATIPIIRTSDCRRFFSNISIEINSAMFCLAHLGNSTGPCQINEGAPVVAQDLLYGVVAWGNPCNVDHYPAIVTRAPVLRTWITETIRLRVRYTDDTP